MIGFFQLFFQENPVISSKVFFSTYILRKLRFPLVYIIALGSRHPGNLLQLLRAKNHTKRKKRPKMAKTSQKSKMTNSPKRQKYLFSIAVVIEFFSSYYIHICTMRPIFSIFHLIPYARNLLVWPAVENNNMHTLLTNRRPKTIQIIFLD